MTRADTHALEFSIKTFVGQITNEGGHVTPLWLIVVIGKLKTATEFNAVPRKLLHYFECLSLGAWTTGKRRYATGNWPSAKYSTSAEAEMLGYVFARKAT